MGKFRLSLVATAIILILLLAVQFNTSWQVSKKYYGGKDDENDMLYLPQDDDDDDNNNIKYPPQQSYPTPHVHKMMAMHRHDIGSNRFKQ